LAEVNPIGRRQESENFGTLGFGALTHEAVHGAAM
jgi:hypothetical protein